MRLGEVLTCACACACACAAIAVSPAAASAAEPPVPPAEPLPPASEARPPPLPEPAAVPVPWNHHIEVGGGVALTQMTASGGGPPPSRVPQPLPMRFLPGVGFHLDLSWQVFRYLRFTGYMVEHNNPLWMPDGALATDSRGVGASFRGSVHVYSFGVRASPTLPIGKRVRLWITAGAGWGYLGYGDYTQLNVACGVPDTCVVRGRSSTIFEVPLGVGYSIEIIPRWLSLHFEATGAFVPSQVGEALESPPQGQYGQYIDARHLMGVVYPMPQIGASFVETVGLSLHL